MARVRNAGERKGASKKPTKAVEAKVRKAAKARTPREQAELPEVANTERDPTLEKYGRELIGLNKAKAANGRMVKACQDRSDKRMAESGRHLYRMQNGELLTARERTRQIKVEAKAPKERKPRKRKTEAEGARA